MPGIGQGSKLSVWCQVAVHNSRAPALCRRPHPFKAVYTVTLHGEQLRTDLRVLNTGDAPFDFTAALHTYIEVLDIKVGGGGGIMILKKTASPPIGLRTCSQSALLSWTV